MNRLAVARVMEAFFRRWPLYLLLLVAALIFGFASLARSQAEYTSSGAIFVDNESLVASQTGVDKGTYFSYLPPSQFTSQSLEGLIGTDVFMESVLENAGVQLAEDPGVRAFQVWELQQTISSQVASENLVRVVVTTPDPELSARLADSTIEEFVRFQISLDIAESRASEAFFTDLAEDYQEDLAEARTAVDGVLRGVGDLEDLRVEDQLELERLQEAEVVAETRFRSAVDSVEASRLSALQAETDVRQRYSIFDPPQVPEQTDGSIVDDVLVIAMFAIVGIVLSFVVPLLSALLNRSVMFVDDLQLGPNVPVLAVMPKISKKRLKLAEPEEGAENETAAPTQGAMPVPLVFVNGQGPAVVTANGHVPVAGAATPSYLAATPIVQAPNDGRRPQWAPPSSTAPSIGVAAVTPAQPTATAPNGTAFWEQTVEPEKNANGDVAVTQPNYSPQVPAANGAPPINGAPPAANPAAANPVTAAAPQGPATPPIPAGPASPDDASQTNGAADSKDGTSELPAGTPSAGKTKGLDDSFDDLLLDEDETNSWIR